MSTNCDDMLNADEAAALLGISRNWLYQLVSRGHLRAGRVGSRLRFTRRMLDKDVFGSIR